VEWCKEHIIDLLSLIVSVFTAYIALKALGTWKDELKFKAIEQLEDVYQKYLHSYIKYKYRCSEILYNDKHLDNCPDNIDEFHYFIQAEHEYSILWRKIKPYIKPAEYNSFKFTKNDLQGKLRGLNPLRGGECQSDGYYQLIQNENFEQIMSDLLNDGIEAIQKLRR
jgi:hypothetical protein